MLRSFYTPEIEKAKNENDTGPSPANTRSFTHAIPLCYPSRTGWRYWIKKEIVRIMLQTGNKRAARLPNVPTLYEVMDEFKTTAANHNLAKLVLASSDFGRPFVAPPGLAASQLKIFRDAYNKAMKDPGLLMEAKRSPLEINPTTGQELEVLAKDVIAQPKDLVARMNKLMGKQEKR